MDISILLMAKADFNVMELGILQLLSQTTERMLQFVLQVLWVGAAICWSCSSHSCEGEGEDVRRSLTRVSVKQITVELMCRRITCIVPRSRSSSEAEGRRVAGSLSLTRFWIGGSLACDVTLHSSVSLFTGYSCRAYSSSVYMYMMPRTGFSHK